MERKKEVEISPPVTVAGVTLIPIAEVSLNYWRGSGGISFFGVKQPFGVVVVSPTVKTAFRVTGEEVPLAQLIEEVPGIKGVLEGI